LRKPFTRVNDSVTDDKLPQHANTATLPACREREKRIKRTVCPHMYRGGTAAIESKLGRKSDKSKCRFSFKYESRKLWGGKYQ